MCCRRMWPQLKRDPLGGTATMNQNDIVAPRLPSPRELQLRSLAPFACAALATIVTGVSVVTAFAALLGAFIPMIAAGTFLIALDIRPDRSPLRAQFDLMWDTPTPNRQDRKSTRLNSSHQIISYAVFCLKKKNTRTSTSNITKQRSLHQAHH